MKITIRHTLTISAVLLLCSFSTCLAAETMRFQTISAIGDLRIGSGGYIISEDRKLPYFAPLPNESYHQYCIRAEPVSRSEFRSRKMASDYILLLSPSGGLETEVVEAAFSGADQLGCLRISKVANERLITVLEHGRCEETGGVPEVKIAGISGE